MCEINNGVMTYCKNNGLIGYLVYVTHNCFGCIGHHTCSHILQAVKSRWAGNKIIQMRMEAKCMNTNETNTISLNSYVEPSLLLPPLMSIAAKSGYCKSLGIATPTQCHQRDLSTLVSEKLTIGALYELLCHVESYRSYHPGKSGMSY